MQWKAPLVGQALRPNSGAPGDPSLVRRGCRRPRDLGRQTGRGRRYHPARRAGPQGGRRSGVQTQARCRLRRRLRDGRHLPRWRDRRLRSALELRRHFRLDPIPGRNVDAHRARQAGLVRARHQNPATAGVAQPDLGLIGRAIVDQGEACIAPCGTRQGNAGDDLGPAGLLQNGAARPPAAAARPRPGTPSGLLQIAWSQGPEGVQMAGSTSSRTRLVCARTRGKVPATSAATAAKSAGTSVAGGSTGPDPPFVHPCVHRVSPSRPGAGPQRPGPGRARPARFGHRVVATRHHPRTGSNSSAPPGSRHGPPPGRRGFPGRGGPRDGTVPSSAG